MKISLTPYLQQALEQISNQPVDLSSVQADIEVKTFFDTECATLSFSHRLAIGKDAASAFRMALSNAGLDDLKVFELSRTFDKIAGGV